jgi:hypothetical protein
LRPRDKLPWILHFAPDGSAILALHPFGEVQSNDFRVPLRKFIKFRVSATSTDLCPEEEAMNEQTENPSGRRTGATGTSFTARVTQSVRLASGTGATEDIPPGKNLNSVTSTIEQTVAKQVELLQRLCLAVMPPPTAPTDDNVPIGSSLQHQILEELVELASIDRSMHGDFLLR